MSAALLLRYWKAGLIVVLALVCVAFVQQWHAATIAEGQAIERARTQDSVVAVLSTRLARVDTLVVRDTVRLTRMFARTDTLRDSLLVHLTDTVRTKEFITQAEADQHACVDLKNDCAAFRLSAAEEIATLKAQAHPAPIIVFQPTAKQKGGYGLVGALVDEVVRAGIHLIRK
jgi:hypothetical protein